MTGLQIAALVGGLLAVHVVLVIAVLRWVRRRAAQLAATVRDDLVAAGDRIEVGPEVASYGGGSGNHSRVKGLGAIALTDRRLYFRKLFGSTVEIPRSDIARVRQSKWFRRGYGSGRMHVIVGTAHGEEVAFIVEDHAAWMDRVRALAASDAEENADAPP